jgi:alpha-1,2-mannosyltransferase
MSNRQSSPDAGSVRGRTLWLNIAWWLFCGLTAAVLALAAWRLLGHIPYRIDIEVYRMGGRAWLDDRPLYADNTMFHTGVGLDLPFTYPPLAAIAFSPFAWLSLPVASVAITLTTLVLLIVSTVIVLTRLGVAQDWTVLPGPAWARRCWLAVAIVAPAVIYLEPIRSNFDFGQINVVLMTLVIADCVPRRTPWPRGLLLGLAIALKLTPAVFLLYFALRRDGRAAVTAIASFAVATLAGFVLAARDSWEYWTDTVRNTGRIGTAALNTNQNIAGALARLDLTKSEQFVLWTLGCLAVLAVAVWAAQRVSPARGRAPSLRGEGPQGADGQLMALMIIALFGLVVSPVSWSHHWVWALPTVVVTGVLAYRRRNLALAAVTAAGLALMIWTPIDLMPKHHEATAAWWRQLVGASYVWWALAAIVVAATVVASRSVERTEPAVDKAAVPAAR